MKNFFKQLICFILVLCIGAASIIFSIDNFKVSAESYKGSCGNGAQWYLDNATGALTINGTGSTGSYQVVSGVKAPWDKYKEDILYVEIGEGITIIGSGSFRDCENLLEVRLPESLKEISEMSFSGCNKLQTIDIPTNVNKIDASAFFECPILERVTVSAQNTVFSDIDGVLFNKDKTKLVLFPKGKITKEYAVPSGVTEIGAYAFANCSELINITIPTTVTVIGMYAFMNCRTLFTANIPEGVKSIGPNTFYGCSALYEVKLPSTITSIDLGAFSMCGSLMKINIPNATKNINATAFSGCPNLIVYCEKDSYSNEFCINNSIEYCYSNLSSVYPVANWVFANVPHSGQRYARIDVTCSWAEAKRVCEMLGGHLATVTSAEEMATIKTLLSSGTPSSYWLGASDEKTEGTWEWVTGETFSYSLWSSGQPDDCGGVEDYLETWGRGESWNDNSMSGSSTSSNRGFVCEFENYYIPSKTTVYNGNIYCLYDELVSWYTAYNVCENMGGHLATITSAEEQKIITDLCYGSFYTAYWLGATDDSSEGDWKWVTGEPFSYTNWSSGEPNNANSKEHYLEQYYTWNDYIDNGYRGFICEIESFSDLPVSSGYFEGNRYEVYNKNLSWFNAQQIAQSKGGHLATITDVDEASYVNALYKDLVLADDYLNIGGFRYKHETKYRWVTGESFVYSNWNYGEPNGYPGFENYAQIYRYSNGWNDIGNKGSYYNGSVFIVEYESPKQVLTLSNPDGSVINRYKVQGGLSVDKPLKDYKSGYIAEWYKEPSLQNKWNFETDIITEDTVLYAKWSADTYTVTFNANGGECDTESKEATFGTSYGNLPVPTRNGYSFEGWYEDETFTKAVRNDTTVSIADDHTVYAKWQAKTYTVSFAGNGGVLTETTKSVVFGSPYGELPLCSRNGSDFLGWYSDSECTKIIDENTIVNVSGNHTLYAGWNESAVTKLQLKSKPTKTEYYVGDLLDTSGMSVVASFENGSSAEISADRFDYSLTEFTSAGKKIVKATYGGKYTTFFVTVKEKDITAIEITTPPAKTTYTVGDDFDATGMEVTASYNDSSTKIITSGYTISYNMEAAGTEIVTVSYTENGITVTADFPITVNEKQADGKPTITASYATVQAGETVSVPFIVEQNTGFMGFAIEISYDDAVLNPVRVSAGEILSSGNLNDSIGGTVESGTLKVVFYASENIIADGTLFTVEFEAVENAYGQLSEVEIKAVEADCFDENWDTVYFNTSPFEIQIISSVETVPYIAFADAFADESNKIILPLNLKNMLGVTEFKFELVCDRDVMLPNTVICSGLPDGNVELTQSGKKYYLKWSGTKIVQDEVVLNIYFEASEFASGETDVTVACIIPESIDDIGTVVSINKLLPKTTRLETDLAITSAGDTVRIPVYIKYNNGIMGFGLTVEYDDSVLTPISVSRGEILTNGLMDNNISTASGSFKIVWNNTANLTKDGELLVIEFAIASNIDVCASDISFTYSQQDTYNETWQDVELEIENTAVLIDPIYVVPQSGAVENNGYVFGLKAGLKSLDGYFETVSEDITFYAIASDSRFGSGSVVRVQYNGNTADVYKTILFGDVNGDGWYDAEDAFLVNLIVAGLLTEDKLPAYMWKAADCNHDGVINEFDVELLMGAGVRKNDIDQNAAQAELVTQTAYIEYASLIDQSAGMYPDIAPMPDMDDIDQGTTPPETNETVEPDGPVSEDHMDFEVIFTNIFEFIKKILSLIFSFII